jgi:hypothetical protein
MKSMLSRRSLLQMIGSSFAALSGAAFLPSRSFGALSSEIAQVKWEDSWPALANFSRDPLIVVFSEKAAMVLDPGYKVSCCRAELLSAIENSIDLPITVTRV